MTPRKRSSYHNDNRERKARVTVLTKRENWGEIMKTQTEKKRHCNDTERKRNYHKIIK